MFVFEWKPSSWRICNHYIDSGQPLLYRYMAQQRLSRVWWLGRRVVVGDTPDGSADHCLPRWAIREVGDILCLYGVKTGTVGHGRIFFVNQPSGESEWQTFSSISHGEGILTWNLFVNNGTCLSPSSTNGQHDWCILLSYFNLCYSLELRQWVLRPRDHPLMYELWNIQIIVLQQGCLYMP